VNKTKYLNSHHIFSRNNYSVRWNPSNGVCLCAGHHVLCNFSAHKAPLEFAEWLKEKRGKKWYEQLRKKAKQTSQIKPDKLTIKNELCKKIKELENVKVQFK